MVDQRRWYNNRVLQFLLAVAAAVLLVFGFIYIFMPCDHSRILEWSGMANWKSRTMVSFEEYIAHNHYVMPEELSESLSWDELFSAWEASESFAQEYQNNKGLISAITEKNVPNRTVCVDFVNEPHCGPSQQNISSWSQIAKHCYEDILEQSNDTIPSYDPTFWWTVADHFNERGNTPNPQGRRLIIPALIGHTSDASAQVVYSSPRDLGIVSISAALREMLERPEDTSDDASLSLQKRTVRSEKRAFASFLAMCYLNLNKDDTVQLFVCNLGKPLSDGSPPPIVVRLLGFLKPGVRIVVYEGEVKWTGQDGSHSGPDRTVYFR